MWKLNVVPSFIELGHEFLLLSFQNQTVKWKALLNGPTFIQGHLLSICPWFPLFNPSSKIGIYSPIWIRLENLPLEFYNHQVLIRIGNSLGSFLGMDAATHHLLKARFARICILTNISENLPPSIIISKFIQQITYENLPPRYDMETVITQPSKTPNQQPHQWTKVVRRKNQKVNQVDMEKNQMIGKNQKSAKILEFKIQNHQKSSQLKIKNTNPIAPKAKNTALSTEKSNKHEQPKLHLSVARFRKNLGEEANPTPICMGASEEDPYVGFDLYAEERADLDTTLSNLNRSSTKERKHAETSPTPNDNRATPEELPSTNNTEEGNSSPRELCSPKQDAGDHSVVRTSEEGSDVSSSKRCFELGSVSLQCRTLQPSTIQIDLPYESLAKFADRGAESLDEEPEDKQYDSGSSSKRYLEGTKGELVNSFDGPLEQLGDTQDGNMVPSGVSSKRSPPKRSINTGVLVPKGCQRFRHYLVAARKRKP
ncbi:uncharacterized protein G2W53_027312 [Senna tora]|uniref:DUF4283 domain-containing protein n=1 Tax=Senna tora TaxID=362788 RepID=A0A834WGJ0_9FABA|nr:uncharacterized protein G2W53_027312 [Senna tora]